MQSYATKHWRTRLWRFYHLQILFFVFQNEKWPIMPKCGTCPVWVRLPSVSGWNQAARKRECHLAMPFQYRKTNCSWLITRTLPYVLVVKRSKLYTINGVFLWKNSRLIVEILNLGPNGFLTTKKKKIEKQKKFETGFFSVGNHKTLISRIKSTFTYHQDLPFSFRFRFYSVNPARVWIF